MKTREFKGASLIAFPSDYTVIDIETTGLYPTDSEIIEVSAIRVRDEACAERFSTLIKPRKNILPFITELTGITNGMVQDAPRAEEILPEFYDFIAKDVLIGHNVNFDVNFLYDSLLYYNRLTLTNSFVDVLRLARKALPFLPNHKQSTIANYFGVSAVGAHRAMRDCEICNANYLLLKRAMTSST